MDCIYIALLQYGMTFTHSHKLTAAPAMQGEARPEQSGLGALLRDTSNTRLGGIELATLPANPLYTS